MFPGLFFARTPVAFGRGRERARLGEHFGREMLPQPCSSTRQGENPQETVPSAVLNQGFPCIPIADNTHDLYFAKKPHGGYGFINLEGSMLCTRA